jgi:UDP-N-acetylglucosamine diphosphorylase/glucosamine-1-phosphate N-acetyltransferase
MPGLINDVAVIILAAGKGTRMKSGKAKVLHEIEQRPMIDYVVDSASRVAGGSLVVVVGHQADAVKAAVMKNRKDVIFALQSEQLGTGHAVSCAMPHIPEGMTDIVILCGDVPLLSAPTVERLLAEHKAAERDLTILAVELDNPDGYGRVLMDAENRVTGIIEQADATAEQKRIRIVNSGIYCTTAGFLNDALGAIDADNAQAEFYLTDIMEIGHRAGKNVGALVWRDSLEVMGVNTVEELELAETIMKSRKSKTA